MTQTPSFSVIRVAARLANGFALDLVKLGGFGRDVIDGLLLAAITAANTAPITRDPALQLAYAYLDQPPPDELRRPVSVNAVAASLHVPFETARRRIAALAEAGIVQVTPKGVIVPTAPLDSPFYRIAATAHYQLVRTFYGRLWNLGLLRDIPRRETPFRDPTDPPVRLVLRLSGEYVLRLAEPLTAHIGDLVTGLVLMDIVQANTEHLLDSEAGDDSAAIEAFVADSRRRPVRVATLAERLGIPHETVRRHVLRLVEQGRCAGCEDGYVIPAEVLARGPFVQYMLDNQIHLQRLFGALGEMGVLAAWDAEAAQLRGAA